MTQSPLPTVARGAADMQRPGSSKQSEAPSIAAPRISLNEIGRDGGLDNGTASVFSRTGMGL